MVQFVTKDELRNFAAKKTVTEQAELRKRAETASVSASTFLSHSRKDKELVVGATIVLENHGARVYVDSKDPELPPYTNAETASLLKRRITDCRRFVMLSTEESKNSKWVPWELGFADGKKGLNKLAVFPASEKGWEQNWAKSEYLGLYSKIVWGHIKGEAEPRWLVWNARKNTATGLRSWLTG